MKSIVIIGQRGLISQLLQVAIKSGTTPYYIEVISTEDFIVYGADHPSMKGADIVVMCVELTKTQDVFERIPFTVKVLDISPTYRCNPNWTYGLEEIVGSYNIRNSRLVANPGCFATSAILLLAPLVEAGLCSPTQSFYLDGTGGYTTGGIKMMEKYESSDIPDTAYSLAKEHLHVAEIKRVCELRSGVVFTPKIAKVPGGIRMMTFIDIVANTTVLKVYQEKYERFGNIRVDCTGNDGDQRIAVNEMAGCAGAILRAYNHDCGNGTLVVCTMDNLLRGCIEPAMNNIRLMLG